MPNSLTPEERRYAEDIIALPGVTVNEIRNAWGLPNLPPAQFDVGNLILNLPGPDFIGFI